MGGGREIVKRQIGCRGALSAVTVDLDTVSQSHIFRASVAVLYWTRGASAPSTPRWVPGEG
jgi:hypothetical protein